MDKKSRDSFSFSDIAESVQFYQFFDILKKITGIKMVLVKPVVSKKQWFIEPPVSGSKWLFEPIDMTPLCRLIRQNKEGKNRCYNCDWLHYKRMLERKKGLEYLCHAGLVDFIVPIFYKNCLLGTINGGQTLLRPPCEKGLKRLLRRVGDLGIDHHALHKAYFETPYLNRDKLKAVLQLLNFFAEYFCEMEIAVKTSRADSLRSEIDAAKEYIQQCFKEEISLSEVADHVYLSAAYLGSLFKKTTGLNYSHYVQQLRVHEAKKLLSDSKNSITSIAFTVGFNNLTHFHKVFKKFEGCTPKHFRDAVHKKEKTK